MTLVHRHGAGNLKAPISRGRQKEYERVRRSPQALQGDTWNYPVERRINRVSPGVDVDQMIRPGLVHPDDYDHILRAVDVSGFPFERLQKPIYLSVFDRSKVAQRAEGRAYIPPVPHYTVHPSGKFGLIRIPTDVMDEGYYKTLFHELSHGTEGLDVAHPESEGIADRRGLEYGGQWAGLESPMATSLTDISGYSTLAGNIRSGVPRSEWGNERDARYLDEFGPENWAQRYLRALNRKSSEDAPDLRFPLVERLRIDPVTGSGGKLLVRKDG